MKCTSFTAILFATFIGCASFAHAANTTEYQAINSLFKQGQYNTALDKVNVYISKNPQDPQARFLKGLILTEQNKTADAIKVFTGLTEDFPELPEPYNNLAVLYAAQGQYEKAKDALEMAIHTHPSYATANENLGDIYAKMASIAYDKALKLDSTNTSAHTKLALIKDIFNPHGPGSNAVNSRECEGKSDVSTIPVAPASAASATTAPASAPGVLVNTETPVPSRPAATNKVTESPAEDAINSALQTWARAWSGQHVKAYLAMYSPEFKPSTGESHEAWVASRRERISKPKKIDVQLSDIHITVADAAHATVSLKQHYHSDQFSSSTHKVLTLQKIDGKWLIAQENSH